MKNVAAVVLAAGEGTRIKARNRNKVTFLLAGKPMIWYSVQTIKKAGIEKIVAVIKFKAESVKKALGSSVEYSLQGEKKGTAAALEDGIKNIKSPIDKILVIYGDDSAFYTPDLFKFIVAEHDKNLSDVTVLSIKLSNPSGLGRIVRGTYGEIEKIVEEKVASDKEKIIQEINTGCYCFSLDFLNRFLPEIKINPVSGEYYLTDIVDVALKNGRKVHVSFYPDSSIWFGVNDRSQWARARLLKTKQGK
ncbi:NTP transferase domain-containing protein [Candidatus Collierbacteria bacterium]|nr:NTP transferase domain-containing protein [Candidatus Collierbacteria bacterium]